MEITVKDLQKKIKINSRPVIQLATQIIQFEGISKVSLAVVFVSRQRIAALNKKYLGRAYATDVLAFDFNENKSRVKTLNGDIIISVDQAVKNAALYGTVLSDEISLYIVHGILHLLGFDDHGKGKVRKMRREEEKLMKYLAPKSRRAIVSL